MKAKNFDSFQPQRSQRLINVAGVNEAAVGDQQGPSKAELLRYLAETRNCTGAKDHACTGLKVEGIHFREADKAR